MVDTAVHHRFSTVGTRGDDGNRWSGKKEMVDNGMIYLYNCYNQIKDYDYYIYNNIELFI